MCVVRFFGNGGELIFLKLVDSLQTQSFKSHAMHQCQNCCPQMVERRVDRQLLPSEGLQSMVHGARDEDCNTKNELKEDFAG
jgi:hypothetical protein